MKGINFEDFRLLEIKNHGGRLWNCKNDSTTNDTGDELHKGFCFNAE